MRLVMDRCKDANQLTDKRAFCNDGDDAPACGEESRAEGGRAYFIGRRLSWRMDSIWLPIPQNRSLEGKPMNMFSMSFWPPAFLHLRPRCGDKPVNGGSNLI